MCAQHERDEMDFLFGCIFMIFMTVAACANAIVLEIFILKKKYKQTYNLAYMNLAVSDALAATFGATIRGPGYMFGITNGGSCKMSFHLSLVIFHANLASVLPITIDRFTAVIFPLKYKGTAHRKTVYVSIFCSWFLSVLFLVSLHVSTLTHSYTLIVFNRTTCECHLGQWEHLDNVFYVRDTVFMYLPLLVNLVLYSIVIRHLNSSKKKFRSMHGYLILLRVIVICGLFTLSWLPMVILSFVALSMDLNHTFSLACQLALYSNCVTDPIMYTLPNKLLMKIFGKFSNTNNFINEKKVFGSLDKARLSLSDPSPGAQRPSTSRQISNLSTSRQISNSSKCIVDSSVVYSVSQ